MIKPALTRRIRAGKRYKRRRALPKLDGTFELNIITGKYLVFSFIGYETQEVYIDGIRKFNVSA
jgi:hypothetical protein